MATDWQLAEYQRGLNALIDARLAESTEIDDAIERKLDTRVDQSIEVYFKNVMLSEVFPDDEIVDADRVRELISDNAVDVDDLDTLRADFAALRADFTKVCNVLALIGSTLNTYMADPANGEAD